MEKSTVPLDVGRSGHLPLTECATKNWSANNTTTPGTTKESYK